MCSKKRSDGIHLIDIVPILIHCFLVMNNNENCDNVPTCVRQPEKLCMSQWWLAPDSFPLYLSKLIADYGKFVKELCRLCNAFIGDCVKVRMFTSYLKL